MNPDEDGNHKIYKPLFQNSQFSIDETTNRKNISVSATCWYSLEGRRIDIGINSIVRTACESIFSYRLHPSARYFLARTLQVPTSSDFGTEMGFRTSSHNKKKMSLKRFASRYRIRHTTRFQLAVAAATATARTRVSPRPANTYFMLGREYIR